MTAPSGLDGEKPPGSQVGFTVRLGLTLPSFQEDPEVVIGVARAAEAAGVDGVFAFDHLFRLRADGTRRPALELTTLLAAVAAETSTITVGSLVARAGLRPPAGLAAAFDTIHRIAPGRLVAGVGSGDAESAAEERVFGISTGATPEGRVGRLTATVGALKDRGYPVWVGGSAPAVRRLAATAAGGWNLWGGEPSTFSAGAADVASLARDAGRDTAAVACSWGGLAVLGATEAQAEAKMARLGRAPEEPGLVWGGPDRAAGTLRTYVEAGARWVILGPIDSSDPDNAALVAEVAGLVA